MCALAHLVHAATNAGMLLSACPGDVTAFVECRLVCVTVYLFIVATAAIEVGVRD